MKYLPGMTRLKAASEPGFVVLHMRVSQYESFRQESERYPGLVRLLDGASGCRTQRTFEDLMGVEATITERVKQDG